MINTRDEIMIALAGILDDVPPPPIPVFDQDEKEKTPKEEEAKEEVQVQQTPIPIPVPVTDQPKEEVQSPQPVVEEQSKWVDQDMGKAQWVADNYPYSYLFGHKPFLGFVRDPKYDSITIGLLRKIANEEPEKFFEWGIHAVSIRNKLGNSDDWTKIAAKNLVEKDPYAAIVLGIQDGGRAIRTDPDILPNLWNKIIESEFQRSANSEDSNIFPGVIFGRMRDLAKTLKEYHPEFYEANLADNALAQRIESGRGFAFKKTKKAPISQREEKLPWQKPEPGTPEWIAEKYPFAYLRGQNTFIDRYVREFQDPSIITPIMAKLVDENPIKYFEWGLNRVGSKGGYIDLRGWLVPAAESLIQKDPYAALMFGRIYQYDEVQDLLPSLWQKLIELEGENPKGEEIFRNMRSMAGKISKSNPEFYLKNIKGTIYSTKAFDSQAMQMLQV